MGIIILSLLVMGLQLYFLVRLFKPRDSGDTMTKTVAIYLGLIYISNVIVTVITRV